MVHIAPTDDSQLELGAPLKTCPENQPSLDAMQSQGSALNQYKVREEVQVLRSDGSWSVGAVTEISRDRIVVCLPSGTKQIRIDMMDKLVKKLEPEEALELQKLRLACQQANQEVENARLARERLMMRLQAKGGKPTRVMRPTQDQIAGSKYDLSSFSFQGYGRSNKRGPFVEDKTLILATW